MTFSLLELAQDPAIGIAVILGGMLGGFVAGAIAVALTSIYGRR